MTATLCKASTTWHHSLNKTTPTTAGHSHRHSHGCSHRKPLGLASSMTGSTTKKTPITTRTTDIVVGQSAQPNLNATYFVSGERPLQPRRFLGPIILAFIASLFWVWLRLMSLAKISGSVNGISAALYCEKWQAPFCSLFQLSCNI